MVQVKKGAATYNAECKIAGWSADISGLVLVDGRKTMRLRTISSESVNLNAQYQSQLNFLDQEISRKIGESYQLSMDPQCKENF